MLDEALNIILRTDIKFQSVVMPGDSPLSDELLVQAVLAGDEAAFEAIFNTYRRPITRVVSRYFRERSDIEEFVQQCFTKAYFSLKKFRGNGSSTGFNAWLTRIAINVCYDEFRRRQRKAENLFTEMGDEETEYIETVADGKLRAADNSLAAEQLVERMLAGLDAEDRMAMTMVYSQEYSLDEASNALGISTSNLKSRLFRCRQSLKRRFGHLISI